METVNPATAKTFTVTSSFANPDPAGTTGTVTVTAKDAYGNTVGSGPNHYEGTVNLVTTDGQAAGVPVSHVFAAVDAGSFTFTNVILKTAGSQTITATDSVTSTITGSTTVNVTALVASQLVFITPPPDPVTAGQSFTVVVAADDQYLNVDTTFNSNVMLSLPGSPGFPVTVQAKNGIATFTGLTVGTAASGSALTLRQAA